MSRATLLRHYMMSLSFAAAYDATPRVIFSDTPDAIDTSPCCCLMLLLFADMPRCCRYATAITFDAAEPPYAGPQHTPWLLATAMPCRLMLIRRAMPFADVFAA